MHRKIGSNPAIECACGCHQSFPKFSAWGYPRRFVNGHNRKSKPLPLRCSITDCKRKAVKRTWCGTHYRRWWRNGDPLFVRPRPSTHGLSRHPLYWLWSTMMQRCYNPRQVQYPRYGKRGIRVCSRWHAPANFIADMGSRPAGHSLDRINSDGHYSPENVRWATPTTQSRNRRSNKLDIEKAAQIRSLFATGVLQVTLAKRFGVNAVTIHNIVRGNIWR